MTDDEIIKALEEHIKLRNLGVCKPDVPLPLLIKLLDLTNRQQAEIERLNIELKAMRGAANSYKAEVERYKGVIKLLEEDVKTAKPEAVKEFAAKVKDIFSPEDEVRQDIDNLVQEMAGE